jgi:exopolysaccharide biosynthesis polyprenyl glycosylphosphotransferase
VFRGHHRKVRLLFGISDILLTALAFEISYRARVAVGPQPFTLEHDFELTTAVRVLLMGWSMLVWVGAGMWWQIYDRIDSASARVVLRDATRQCLVGSVAVVVFEFLLRLDLSRLFLVFFAVTSWFLICLFRLNAGRLAGVVRREFTIPNYVMIVGVGEAALRMARNLEAASEYGLRLTGFLAEPGAAAPQEIELGATYPVHSLSQLPELLKQHVIDEIIFAVDSRRIAELEEVFLLCDEEGVRTRIAVDFFPHVNSQMYLDRLGTSPLLTFSATPHDEILLLIKRVTDLVVASVALLVLWPFMLVIGLLIRATSPGPAIFKQVRCGLNGRKFVFYKFRSMCENAEAMRASLEQHSHREIAMKIKDDPRLTRIGRWLRKFSIDEWPQLWNVVKGDMSLVGPRPPLPEEVAQYQRWQRRRLRMRPGLTCLWAVNGRDNVDFESWMKMDMQYIDNWSLGLDWKILLRTIPQVLSGRGAH